MPEFIPKARFPEELAMKAIQARYGSPTNEQRLIEALTKIGVGFGERYQKKKEAERVSAEKLREEQAKEKQYIAMTPQEALKSGFVVINPDNPVKEGEIPKWSNTIPSTTAMDKLEKEGKIIEHNKMLDAILTGRAKVKDATKPLSLDNLTIAPFSEQQKKSGQPAVDKTFKELTDILLQNLGDPLASDSTKFWVQTWMTAAKERGVDTSSLENLLIEKKDLTDKDTKPGLISKIISAIKNRFSPEKGVAPEQKVVPLPLSVSQSQISLPQAKNELNKIQKGITESDYNNKINEMYLALSDEAEKKKFLDFAYTKKGELFSSGVLKNNPQVVNDTLNYFELPEESF